MAVSISIANVATYGFTVLAARILGPHQYGAVAALMATVLVTSVLPLGLQATGARRVSAEPEHRAEIEREVLRVGWVSALGLGVLLLIAAPALERLLKLDSLAPALLVAATSVPLTLMGAQSGVLQGERRWAPLSLIYLALGIPRLVIGVAFIAWEPTQTSAMMGTTIAAVCPAVVGWLALRHRIESYIRDQIRDPELSIDMIASALRCSKRYLHMAFAACDRSITDHIWTTRLDGCRSDLARRSDLTISEIAFAWGFSSSAHFSRAFRKRFGVTPSAFRHGDRDDRGDPVDLAK